MALEGSRVRKILTITIGLVSLVGVSGCEHLEAWQWKGEQPHIVDAGAQAPSAPVVRSANDPSVSQGAASGHRFPPPTERDLFVMTDKLSGGSIEIYDTNSGKTYGSRGGGGVQAGMPSSVDSSVEIYPVEGTYAGQMAQTWPNSVLPRHDITISPVMQNVSSSGRVSPHVGSGYAPSQIFFKHGSSRLGDGDRKILREVAEQAKFSPVDRVRIEGHASARTGVSDPVEAKIVNLKESMNRAFNVSSQLMRDGVPAEKIQTTVWGDTKNSGDEAHNRRVDIITGGQ